MFRMFTRTTVAATIVALLPGLASAQNFFTPYGASSYTRPVQYGSPNCNTQSILPGGCYGGACPMPCGTTGACAQHGLVNCPQCQGRAVGQLPCAQHGLVNCPQCQGMNQQYPVQYNLNGYGGTNYQPTQYVPSNGPYFQAGTSTNNRTRGNPQPLPMQQNWYAPVSSTYGNQNVSLY